jgi:hypothetical protein
MVIESGLPGEGLEAGYPNSFHKSAQDTLTGRSGLFTQIGLNCAMIEPRKSGCSRGEMSRVEISQQDVSIEFSDYDNSMKMIRHDSLRVQFNIRKNLCCFLSLFRFNFSSRWQIHFFIYFITQEASSTFRADGNEIPPGIGIVPFF